MGLAQVQAALARLYTDPAWRERFQTAPAPTAAALGLDAAEARQLAALPAAQVELVARSLVRKRLGEVAKLLPLSRQAFGPRFAALFWQHAAAYQPRGLRRHARDAVAFAAFLARAAPTELLVSPWAADLARYEAGWLTLAAPGPRLHVCWLGHDPRALVRALTRGGTPPAPRAALALWLRPLPRGRAWHAVLALPSGR